MARSFKKTPGWTNSGTDTRRYHKKAANASVRMFRLRVDDLEDGNLDIPNGGFYKRISESWDICDSKWILYSKEEYRQYVEKCWKEYEEHLANPRYIIGWHEPDTESEVYARIVRPKRK